MANRYPDNLSELTDDELQNVKLSVENELSGVKQQLEEAKGNAMAYGEYAKPSWYARASSAKRLLGMTHQRVLGELSRRRKVRGQSEARAIEKAFMDVAREVLEASVFEYIFSEARKEVEL